MLEQISLFAGLSEDEIQAIEKSTVKKHYRKNTVFIERGDEANTLYFIVSGRVKVYVAEEDGKEMIVNELHDGDYLGELALVGCELRTASAMTIEDSDFLVLTKTSFMKLIAEHPNVALNLIQDLSSRVRCMTEEVSALALLDVYGRIAKLLTDSAVQESDRLITGRLTHQDIASRVGSSREMVSKILKDLRIGGYLDQEGKRFILLRPLPANW